MIVNVRSVVLLEIKDRLTCTSLIEEILKGNE